MSNLDNMSDFNNAFESNKKSNKSNAYVTGYVSGPRCALKKQDGNDRPRDKGNSVWAGVKRDKGNLGNGSKTWHNNYVCRRSKLM